MNGTTFKRKNRSARKCPSSISFSIDRWVAEIILTSTGTEELDPTGSTTRSCNTLSNLTCISIGISPISSRNNVPLCAATIFPIRSEMAPVKALFCVQKVRFLKVLLGWHRSLLQRTYLFSGRGCVDFVR